MTTKEADYFRQYRLANAERIRERNHQHYLANKERIHKRQKAYVAANAEKVKEYKHEHYEANKPIYREQNKAWEAANQERAKATKHAYYEAHKELWKEKSGEWKKTNPERSRQIKKAWKERNPEASREHYTRNPEMYSAYSRNRKARVKSAEGTHTADDVKEIWFRQGKQCAVPGCTHPIAEKKGPYKYHVDHITPVIKGGSNSPENLQILCRKHNLEKHDCDETVWANRHGMLFVK